MKPDTQSGGKIIVHTLQSVYNNFSTTFDIHLTLQNVKNDFTITLLSANNDITDTLLIVNNDFTINLNFTLYFHNFRNLQQYDYCEIGNVCIDFAYH